VREPADGIAEIRYASPPALNAKEVNSSSQHDVGANVGYSSVAESACRVMNPESLAAIIEHGRGMLVQKVEPDPYLCEVAGRSRSHWLLGNAVQMVYQRQVGFLSDLILGYTGRPAEKVNILDWGCGRGHITYLLRKRGFSVTACDRDGGADENSAFRSERPILTEQSIDVVPLTDDVKLPFQTGSFDCVTSFGVLEHVARDLDSLKEIRRVLRPGGLLYITFLPYRLSWTQAAARLFGDRYHDRLYGRRRLRELAYAAEFRVQAIWFGQLFPKNPTPLVLDRVLEPIDRLACRYTPLKYFATNLEAVLTAN
jgi:SAM-dependent methyltransferase